MPSVEWVSPEDVDSGPDHSCPSWIASQVPLPLAVPRTDVSSPVLGLPWIYQAALHSAFCWPGDRARAVFWLGCDTMQVIV